MQTSPRVLRKRQQRIDAIVEAAMDLVADAGLEGLTIQQLASELDYTPGALYRYFDSKEHLLAELERRVVADIASEFAKAYSAGGATADPLVPLLFTARFYARLPEQLPQGFALISRVMADPRRLIREELDQPINAHLAPLLETVAGLFEAAVAAGALEPGASAERALGYWAALHGALQLRKLDTLPLEGADPMNLVPVVTRALLVGWGADPKRLAAAEAALDATVRP